MSDNTKHVAEGRLNKNENHVVIAKYESVQLYFKPETEELVVLSDTEAGEFEDHWRDLLTRVDQFHQANAEYSATIEKYSVEKLQANQSFSEQEKRVNAITKIEDAIDKKRKALQEKLGKFENNGMGYKDVVELIPILDTRKKRRGKNGVGRRYVYVSKKYYEDKGKGNKLHTVTLKSKDKASDSSSIYSKNKHGKTVIDTAKLRKQMLTLKGPEGPKITAQLKDYINLDDFNIDETLIEWAESWNNSLHGEKQLGDSIDIGGGAQFLRFVSNVGASVEFDPLKGKVSIKGEAKAKLSIASGVANAIYYLPDRSGWNWTYNSNTQNELIATKSEGINLGWFRLYIENQLIGFVGASVQVESQLQVMVLDKNKQVLTGKSDGHLPRFSERKAKGKEFYNKMDTSDEGADISAQAFGGAKIEYSLRGGAQWLKPTPATETHSPDVKKSQTVGEFADFCSIGTSIAGMAGVGAGAQLKCDFINGKFCFKIAASLCCGLGAKGSFLCEVGYGKLKEFSEWLVYQLFGLDYHMLELITEEAFSTLSKMCVMSMMDIGNNIYQAYDESISSVISVITEFDKWIKSIIDENKKNIVASAKRNQLAKNIISRPADLLTYTPETKGILLYLLTRHGVWDHLDIDNHGHGFLPDIYADRKEAVILILTSIQTRREWSKVMCHRSVNGADLATEETPATVIAEQERQLQEFLQEGFNRDKEMSKARLELTAIHSRLKKEVSWGYALAMNNTYYYQLNTQPHPHYPERCTFGPCDDNQKMMA